MYCIVSVRSLGFVQCTRIRWWYQWPHFTAVFTALILLATLDGVLRPILASPESSSNVAHRRPQVGDNPTGTSLTLLVSEDVPLNEKQRLVVERVLSSALTWARHLYNASKRDQNLLYVGGEGGVGKSQIIKAIV